MKRYKAFDPPEYVAWTGDPKATREFRATIQADRVRAAVIAALSSDRLEALYRGLLRNRLTDIALKRLVRQGVISKAWLGTGEEASTIGPVHALRRPEKGMEVTPHPPSPTPQFDIVAPMIRNSGACHEMGMPVADILRAYMATADGPSRGRDGHYGAISSGILPPISHVGDVVPVVTGIALTMKMRGESRVALTWIGDGSTKTGTAHEGLNFAAVQKVPAIFIIQNNQVALGTRLDQHHVRGGDSAFADWPDAYGMWGGVFDGNNVLDAFALTWLAAERCRDGRGPALLVAETFRMGGHATHDEAEARVTFPKDLFERWGRLDPIASYEEYLVEEGFSRETLSAIELEVETEVRLGEEQALASRQTHMPSPESALAGVYAEPVA
ncbi:MAG: thiamine pyrophosphate-dependent dehydrogenase E1 component subunit alpha [Anaerolineae bacterium]|nr:thiamine pyrophosphate-dependent dehydrogenase E1 component subunit alpha [Gemmatimonadaceae bacterium]